MQKHMERTAQSTIIAIHTPMTPSPRVLPSIIPITILNTHMEPTPTIIVYVTSPDALKTWGSEKDSGHISTAHKQYNIIRWVAILPVYADNPYISTINGVDSSIRALLTNIIAYTHFISLRE